MDITPALIEELAGQFDDLCNSRMKFGQEKYGDFTWLEAPTMSMVLEEMADMVNYIRFSAVKVLLMSIALQGQETMGNEAFTPSSGDE